MAELTHDDDNELIQDSVEGVYINPLTVQYFFDKQNDVECAINIECAEEIELFCDSTFDIIAQREKELGCPLALH